MFNPYQVVRDFEREIGAYTGAKHVVTVSSCTMAILLACEWHRQHPPSPEIITMPKYSYVGVPMSIMHAGFDVAFDDREWLGQYQLNPLPVWDSARLFTSGMYSFDVSNEMMDINYNRNGQFVCVSFHWSKTLSIGQGGAILHDNDEADEWFRMMRFDGRKEGIEPRSQKDWVLGWHCYLSPRDAAEGLSRLSVLPEQNDPLPNDDYPDLSKIEVFK